MKKQMTLILATVLLMISGYDFVFNNPFFFEMDSVNAYQNILTTTKQSF